MGKKTLDLGLRIVQALADLGIKPDFLGKFTNVKKAFTGGKATFFKPHALETLRGQNKTFNDALNLLEDEAKYIVNATDAEKMAFLNNLAEYKSLGGPKKTTSSGIASTRAMQDFKKTQSDLKKAIEDLQGTAKKAKDEAEVGKKKALKDLDDFLTTGGQPLKAKDNKFLGGSMHEEGQIRTGIREFLQNEYKNGRLKLNDLDKQRVMEYSPMIEHDPILVFKRIYGDEAYNKAGSFPGAFEIGENFTHYRKIFEEKMGKDLLTVKNKEYIGDGKLILTKREEVWTPEELEKSIADKYDPDIPFATGGRVPLSEGNRPWLQLLDTEFDDMDPDVWLHIKKLLESGELGYNQGGRAGYYTGGITNVEPKLDDIGHGSDSLMSRTRLMSPGSQATTSTGLNYLLAEDNDNIRVPFSGGGDPRRRAFLKLLATVGGGAAAFKTGILGLGGKSATKKTAKEIIKQSTGSGQPPPYFLKLVEKIKTMGDETAASQDNAIAKKYKDYVMEEDFAGNISIIKKKMDDPYPEEVIMSYKVDEVSLPNKKGSVKVDDYEEFTVRPDGDGKMKDIEPGVPDEVVNEGSVFEDNMTEFGKTKKADGGRIGFSGGASAKAIVKGGTWLIKSLLGTRKQLKTMNLSPGQLKQYLNQIDDQIKSLEAGGKIPDEVIQTIRSDPKFKSVWQNQKSADPDLREMEEVLLEYGQKHASGGLAKMLGE